MLNASGSVYILENVEANLVKVGVTVNNPNERLLDVNRMWLGLKGICQVCGNRRLLDTEGFIPKHVVSLRHCIGSNLLPVEKDISFVSQQLSECMDNSQKILNSRRVRSLEKLIELHKNAPKRVGIWTLKKTFKSKCAYEVESIAHDILLPYLDKTAPFGEVFCCSTDEAIVAIEKALNQV